MPPNDTKDLDLHQQPASQRNNSLVPFDPINFQHEIQSEDRTSIQPMIEVAILNGFFKADGDWTCYRRNYFSVDFSFRLEGDSLHTYHIRDSDNRDMKAISRFHLALSATTDSGKPIDLTSHSAKRDKGFSRVSENPLTFSKAIDPLSPVNEWTASFERMQFKNATANNGRRRNAQQHFFLVVTLFCETGGKEKPLIPVASRKSAPLVVRGRSPGHYSDYRWGSNVETAPPKLDLPIRTDTIFDQSTSGFHLGSKSGEFKLPGPQMASEESSREERPEPVTATTTISDNSSVSSVQSSRSRMSSKSSISSQDETPRRLVDILLLDRGFKALCTDGFRCVDPNRFERNLRRLLRIFVRNFRARLPSRSRLILRYYKHERAVNIASALRTMFATDGLEKGFLLQLKDEKIDKEKLIDRYLDDNIANHSKIDTLDTGEPADLDGSANPSIFNRTMNLFTGINKPDHIPTTVHHFNSELLKTMQQDVDSIPSGSEQSPAEEDDDDDEDEALAPSQIQNLIFESDAWEEAREGLMGFLVPILTSMQQDEYRHNVYYSDLNEALDYRRSLPAKNSLMEVLLYCQAACRALLDEPLLSHFILRKSAAELQSFKNSLLHVEVPVRDDLICHKRVGQELLSLVTEEITRLHAMRCSMMNIYIRCLQDRYQQSSGPKKPCKNMILPFQIIVKKPGSEVQDIRLELEISTKQHNETSRDLSEIRSLTKQLPSQRLNEIAGWVGPDSSSWTSGFRQSIKSLWLPSYEACQSWGKLEIMNVRALVIDTRVGLLVKRWRELGRRAPTPGYKRIEWLCDCSEKLWGDFQIQDAEAVESFTRWLEHPDQQPYHPSASHNPSQLNASSATSTLGHQQAHTRTDSQAANNAPIASTATTPKPLSLPRQPTERYLELCINTGEYDISLAEIHINTPETSITSDGQLFEEIRKRYQKCRGILRNHKWSLFKPIDVHFVRFCLEDGDVGILQSPLSLPTEDAVLHSRSWEFCPCPCPLKEPPPIPTNVFLHLFNSTRTHPRSTWLNRLPKKLHHSIYQRNGGPHVGWQAMGWGVHIIEGPNVKAIFLLQVLLVVISLAGAIVWAVLKGDVQGGFGIAGFVVAATGVLVWTGVGYGIGQQQERFVRM